MRRRPSPDEPYVPQVRPRLVDRLASRRVGRAVERRWFLATTPVASLPLPGLTVTRRGTSLRVVTVQPGVRPEEVRQANLRRVVELCETHDIDYFVVSEEVARQPRVGVPSTQWQRLVDVLVEEASRRPLYAGVAARTRRGSTRRWPELLTRPRVIRAARTQRQLEVFEMVAPQAGAKPYDRPYACLVERWDVDELEGLSAPSRNPLTTYVRGAARTPVVDHRGGLEARTLEAFTAPDVFDVDFPVDAVYLWVDGSDPAWLERRRAALAAHGVVEASHGTGDERFRDNGELRYALRSLDRFAPWVRNVYLVTDQQVPSWLDVDHPRIRLVDHRELFGDRGTLPTFNSHAIGARLHHIDGLSEHYLYLNDDVFFGRPLAPSTFFHANGIAKFFLSRVTLPMTGPDDTSPHEQARRNVAALLHRDFGRLPRRTFFHTPIPQSRSLLEELEHRYAEEFTSTLESQYRSGRDHEVNWWLHAYYGYLTGRAVPGSIRYDYFNLALGDTAARMARAHARRNLDTFCINDSAEATPEQHAAAGAWLEAYFPGPAAWEKGAASTPPQAPAEEGRGGEDGPVVASQDLAQG